MNVEWKILRTLKRPFNIRSKWSIHNVRRWTNGHCNWKNYVEDSYGASGKVQGKFMRGLYATLTLETTSRVRYAEEIEVLNRKIRNYAAELETLKAERSLIRGHHGEHTAELESLQRFIAKKRTEITALSSDVMAIPEAQERLKRLVRCISGRS